MTFIESVRLLMILADVLGSTSIPKGVICRCLHLGINIGPFSLFLVCCSLISATFPVFH